MSSEIEYIHSEHFHLEEEIFRYHEAFWLRSERLKRALGEEIKRKEEEKKNNT